MTKTKSIVLAFAVALFLLCNSAFAQATLSIVSGNGQLACEACVGQGVPFIIFNPVVVQVKDAPGPNGKPVAGATVTWVFNSDPTTQAGFGNVTSSTTTTDANGQASTTFSLTPQLGSLFSRSYVAATITATLTALPAGIAGTVPQSVVFTESDALTDSQTNPGSGSGIIQVQASLVSPAVGTTLTGPAGSVSATPIQIHVGSTTGNIGVPGVAVLVIPPTDTTQPSISCQNVSGSQQNSALTDASGNATCTVVFGPRQGSGTAQVAVGQTNPPFFSANLPFQVTQGIPGGVVPSTGNNQSGSAGATLPAPLVAIVQDQAGNPLPGVNVTWTVSSGSGTLFNVRNQSDSQGRVSANLTLGSSPGAVSIRVTVDGQPQVAAAVFTETVNLAVSGFTTVSGNNQSTAISTAFPAPLVVQVTNNGQPVAGVTVNFAVTSGSATANPPNPQTNAQGQAQTTIQAGATTGAVVVTATVGNFTQTFNLTVTPPGPTLTASSFRNAASNVAGAISPCSLATIVASGIAPGISGSILPPIIGALPLSLNGTSVAFSGTAGANLFAPIMSLTNSNGQESMTIEIPCDLTPGNVSVTVATGPNSSKSINVTLQEAAPGIFELAGSDRKLRAVILKPDGSFASLQNPARRGELVHVFVTGIGPVNPPIGTNQIGIPDVPSLATDSVIVGLNNSGVGVTQIKYAQDLIGIYDVSFMVPTDAPVGDLPLVVAVTVGGNFIFSQPSTIAVQ